MLVDTKATIKQARWVRKSISGGMRQTGVVTAAARVAVDETFGRGPNGEGGLLRASHEMAKWVEKLWTDMGGTMVYPVHTNMCWLDLDAAGCSTEAFISLGAVEGLRFLGNRLVTHYQVA